MSINKKTLLGTVPIELGFKDAVHVAIVSLRSAMALKPGQHITLNSDRDAICCKPGDSFGIVDPFLTAPVAAGTSFFGILHMDQIPNVRHNWDHPDHTFDSPTTEPKRNPYLVRYATQLGVTYEALMAACQLRVGREEQTVYSGPLDENAFDEWDGSAGSDLWYEWANESGHEFYNNGTECCPEYDYPDSPFQFVKPSTDQQVVDSNDDAN